VPYGCGIPNMYMLGYRCRVVGVTGDAAVAPAVPPIYCEANRTLCIKGAKQMVYWNQLEGSNVNVTGFDLAGQPKSPSYNTKMGFSGGAQSDIFLEKGTANSTYIPPSTSSSFSNKIFTNTNLILSLTLILTVLL